MINFNKYSKYLYQMKNSMDKYFSRLIKIYTFKILYKNGSCDILRIL